MITDFINNIFHASKVHCAKTLSKITVKEILAFKVQFLQKYFTGKLFNLHKRTIL